MAVKTAAVHIDKTVADRAETAAIAAGMTLDEYVESLLQERMEEPEGYDAYIREKVLEALNSTKPRQPFNEAMERLDERLKASKRA